jgi:hypothetical protein
MTSLKLADGTIHKLPADFRKAIEFDANATSLWADITPLARNEWICWVTSAKQEATRKRRIEVGIDKMRGGMRRPCCWPGCPHRWGVDTGDYNDIYQAVTSSQDVYEIRPCKDKRGVVFISDVLPWPFSCAEKFFDL